MEPVAKAGAGPVKRGASGRIDLRAAMFASVRTTLCNAVELRILAALVAFMSVTEANAHDVFKAAIFRWEAILELAEGRCFAHANCIADNLTCRKGIIPKSYLSRKNTSSK